MKVAFTGFYLWLDESHPEDSRQVQTCLDEIGTLVDELSKERHNQVFNSRVSQRFSDLFAEYTVHLRNTKAWPPFSILDVLYRHDRATTSHDPCL